MTSHVIIIHDPMMTEHTKLNTSKLSYTKYCNQLLRNMQLLGLLQCYHQLWLHTSVLATCTWTETAIYPADSCPQTDYPLLSFRERVVDIGTLGVTDYCHCSSRSVHGSATLLPLVVASACLACGSAGIRGAHAPAEMAAGTVSIVSMTLISRHGRLPQIQFMWWRIL